MTFYFPVEPKRKTSLSKQFWTIDFHCMDKNSWNFLQNIVCVPR